MARKALKVPVRPAEGGQRGKRAALQWLAALVSVFFVCASLAAVVTHTWHTHALHTAAQPLRLPWPRHQGGRCVPGEMKEEDCDRRKLLECPPSARPRPSGSRASAVRRAPRAHPPPSHFPFPAADAKKFNCVQRGNMNTIEHLPEFFCLYFAPAIAYPLFAFVCTLAPTSAHPAGPLSSPFLFPLVPRHAGAIQTRAVNNSLALRPSAHPPQAPKSTSSAKSSTLPATARATPR